MNKHTPGPWSFDSEDMNIYGSLGESVCNVSRRPKIVGIDDTEKSGLSIQTQANAKLLATAPKLLEALEYAFELLKDYDTPSFYIENVIKEATE